MVEFDWKSLKFSNFSTFWLFLCKTAFFFLPSCQSNDKFGSFFSQIFKGFTLVPWQKVGRIWLGFAGKHSNFKFSLFLPKSLANPSLPFPCIRTIRHQFNFFNFFLFDSVCYYFMFHSGFSKRNFWCKELISSWRIGKVSNLSPISAIFSRQTNDIYVNFFSNFQGFTLSSWQKVGRLWLGFAQNPTSLSNPSLP